MTQNDVSDLIRNICTDKRPSDIRLGQYAFNLLHARFPEVSEKIVGTDDDPFYRDSRIGSFFERLFELVEPEKRSGPDAIIWGDGWYALYDDGNWNLAPIKYFDEHGHCPDGWEWEKPEGFTDDEFEDFVDEHGCEPRVPKGFSYCMESCIEAIGMSFEEQKQTLTEAGFLVRKWDR